MVKIGSKTVFFEVKYWFSAIFSVSKLGGVGTTFTDILCQNVFDNRVYVWDKEWRPNQLMPPSFLVIEKSNQINCFPSLPTPQSLSGRLRRYEGAGNAQSSSRGLPQRVLSPTPMSMTCYMLQKLHLGPPDQSTAHSCLIFNATFPATFFTSTPTFFQPISTTPLQLVHHHKTLLYVSAQWPNLTPWRKPRMTQDKLWWTDQ